MTVLALPSMLSRLTQLTLMRYALASVGALAVDVGCFLGLLTLGAPAALASAIGYSVGIGAHWLMSSRAVFTEVAPRGPGRIRQKALFLGSALIGLAITTSVVGLGELAGADPRLAKLLAIAVSFLLTWLMRAKIVFR